MRTLHDICHFNYFFIKLFKYFICLMNFQIFTANFNGSLATYLNLLAQFQLLTFETFIQRIFNFSPPIIDHWNQFHEERDVLKAELRASTFLQDGGGAGDSTESSVVEIRPVIGSCGFRRMRSSLFITSTSTPALFTFY